MINDQCQRPLSSALCLLSSVLYSLPSQLYALRSLLINQRFLFAPQNRRHPYLNFCRKGLIHDVDNATTILLAKKHNRLRRLKHADQLPIILYHIIGEKLDKRFYVHTPGKCQDAGYKFFSTIHKGLLFIKRQRLWYENISKIIIRC